MAENKFISFREAASVNAAKTESSEGRLYIVPGEDAMVFEGHEFYGGYKKSEVDSKIAAAKSYADNKVQALGNVYRVKGSVTSSGLAALASAAVGDVYNVSEEVTLNGVAYPAGTNVVCVTAFSSAINPGTSTNWDALGGLQDLSAYATKSELASGMANTAKTITKQADGQSVTLELWNNDSSVGKVGSVTLTPVSGSSAGVMPSSLYEELKTASTDISGLKTKVSSIEGSISGINESLSDKASTSDLQSAKSYLEGSINANSSLIDDLQTAVGKKANQTALDALTQTVGTKASQSDLDALIARVAALEELLKLA